MLQSFQPAANVAVVGASGGIGRALTDCLSADPAVHRVHALSRSPEAHTSPKVEPRALDVLDEEALATAASSCSESGPLDLVIVATGILHDGPALQPEKSIRSLDATSLARVYEINTIGPALVAKHFLPVLKRDFKSVFAALSARVGSIEDNRLGGWMAYRASKAALNMILKSASIEHARRHRQSAVVTLHPGTVDTDLSRPFSRNTAPDKLFPADVAAQHLLNVIDFLTEEDTGGFFAWDGQPIPY